MNPRTLPGKLPESQTYEDAKRVLLAVNPMFDISTEEARVDALINKIRTTVGLATELPTFPLPEDDIKSWATIPIPPVFDSQTAELPAGFILDSFVGSKNESE